MANEFVARKGLIVSGSTQLTGSLNVSRGITGSLFGTSSWAVSASWAPDGGTSIYQGLNIETYEFVANGVQTSFDIVSSYDINSLIVSVDGLTFNPVDDYTVSANNLLFINTPPSSSVILVRAFVNATTNLTGTFTGSLLGTASFAISASWAPGGSTSGTKTFARFTPLDNQPPASNFATLDTRNSIATLDFDATANEAAVFVGVVPEGTTFTTGISSSIYWTATSATSGDAIWGIQFEKTSGGQDIDNDGFDVETLVTASTNATSGIVNIVTIGSTTIDSLVAGDLFRVKVFRSGAATADSVTGDAELLAIELESV